MKARALAIATILLAGPVAAQDGPDGALQAVAVSPDDPATVITSSSRTFYTSNDSGNNWNLSGVGTMAWAIRFGPADFAMGPNEERVIYAATQDYGVMYRVVGQPWAYGNGLSGAVRSVAPHPDGQTVYAGTESGIYVSRDRGRNWDLLSDALGSGATQGLVVDPANPQNIYATKWGQGVYRSVDAGTTWQLGNSGLFDTQLFDLDIDEANPSILYATTWSGVFRSVDAGANWIKLDSPSRTSELAIDPVNSDRLIVVTEGNGIARSEDAGQTWTPINAGLNGVTQLLSVDIGPQGAGTVYAGSLLEGLFISNDYGDSWSLVNGTVSGSEPPATPPPPPPITPPPNPTRLSIQINNFTGPEIQYGSTARFDVVVRNTGSYTAEDVVVSIGWSQVGQGSYYKTVRWSGGACDSGYCHVGNLAPGAQLVVSVEGHTGDYYNWIGPFQLGAGAWAVNAEHVNSSVRIDAVKTILSIESGGGANGPFMLLLLLFAVALRSGSRSRLLALTPGA
jgi:photosystem II stability/assembly factor-like uncharacterized protein